MSLRGQSRCFTGITSCISTEIANGRLFSLECHNLLNPTLGPIYHDYGVGSAYASECTIPSRPEQPFGSKENLFPSKKGARANAAKEAVEYLIAAGELNPDGSTKGRKKVKIGTAVRIQGKGLEVKKESSFAQKVNG